MNRFQKILICIASLIIVLIPLSYAIRFAFVLNLPLSPSQEVWGQLGDFIGGTLNPILSFITILLLIQSLNYQYNANKSLKDQISKTEKIENLRTFENLFFNLVTSQSNLFNNFHIKFQDESNRTETLYRAEAVLKIELAIDSMIDDNYLKSQVSEFYEDLDNEYGIFDLLRSFYIVVKLIDDKLADKNGFTRSDRQFYYERLINLTSFSNIRLLLIALQFDSASIVDDLKDNSEFVEVCRRLQIDFDQYEFLS